MKLLGNQWQQRNLVFIKCIIAEDPIVLKLELLPGDEVIFCPTFSASKAILVIS